MPRPLSPRQIDLVSAALRHVRDAEHLVEAGPHRSPDQAWHLAGFGPECIRKACLGERWADKVLGHELGAAGEQALEWALALDAHAWRYDLRDWAVRWPRLASWRPEHRYDRTGKHQAGAAQLVAEARQRVDEVVADLWADGRLPTPAI